MKPPAALPLLVLTVISVLPGCSNAPPPAEKAQDQRITFEITAMLNASAQAWTRNDLDGFMQSFHNSPDLRFVTPAGITMGWDDLRARYAKSINKSDLRFSDIDVTVLAPDAALVFGLFHNTMSDGSKGMGTFTLLVRNIDGQWVTTHDHCSDLPMDSAE